MEGFARDHGRDKKSRHVKIDQFRQIYQRDRIGQTNADYGKCVLYCCGFNGYRGKNDALCV